MLNLKNVCKTTTNSLKQSVDVLSNINVEIRQGDYVCIKGVNGSGKSAILNILGLRDARFVGEYYIDGVELTKFTSKQTAELRGVTLGFVPQFIDLLEKKSVFDNISLPIQSIKMTKAERQERVEKVAGELGLDSSLLKLKAQELSFGQKQKVMIARAVVSSPKAIFLDSPLKNLDEEGCSVVLSLLTRLNREGTTIVVVSNDERFLQKAKRVFTITGGTIIENIKVSKGKNAGEILEINARVKKTKHAPVRRQVVGVARPQEEIDAEIMKERHEQEEKLRAEREEAERIEREKQEHQAMVEAQKSARKKKDDGAEQISMLEEQPKKATKRVATKKTTAVSEEPKDENSEFMIQAVKSGKKRSAKN